MSVHINSVEAYWSERDKLNRRARSIFEHMRHKPPMTDRQIMRSMGFSEPNSVRPRITEMIKLGLMEEVGNTKCPVTDKTVRLVRVAAPPRPATTTQTEMF